MTSLGDKWISPTFFSLGLILASKVYFPQARSTFSPLKLHCARGSFIWWHLGNGPFRHVMCSGYLLTCRTSLRCLPLAKSWFILCPQVMAGIFFWEGFDTAALWYWKVISSSLLIAVCVITKFKIIVSLCSLKLKKDI